MVRARIVFGMELSRQEPGMVRQLDDLHQAIVRGKAAEHQAFGCQLVAVRIIEFVAMAMALADLAHPVHFLRQRPCP